MSNTAVIIEDSFGKETQLMSYPYELAKHVARNDLIHLRGEDYRVNYRRFLMTETNYGEGTILIEIHVSKH